MVLRHIKMGTITTGTIVAVLSTLAFSQLLRPADDVPVEEGSERGARVVRRVYFEPELVNKTVKEMNEGFFVARAEWINATLEALKAPPAPAGADKPDKAACTAKPETPGCPTADQCKETPPPDNCP